MGLLFKILAIWSFISVGTLGAGILSALFRRALLRRKVRMTEVDGSRPLPLFDQRKKQRDNFQLGLTRRALTVEDGIALETLEHAVDYLFKVYALDHFRDTLPENRPPEVRAVEILLHARFELLEGRPPLPSVAYLVSRRFAWLMATAANRHS